MVTLTDAMKELLTSNLCYIATASPDAMPCVAPKSCRFTEDGELYFTEWVGKKTYQNMLANPRVAISSCSADKKTSFRFEGPVRLLTDGPLFDKEDARRRDKGKMPVVTIVIVDVQAVYNMSRPVFGERLL